MRVKLFLASVRADLVDMAAVVNRREQPLERSVPMSATQFSLHRTSWAWIFCLAVQRMYGPLRHLSNLGVSGRGIVRTCELLNESSLRSIPSQVSGEAR